MPLLTEETLEELDELLAELRKRASDGVPIIVEGADDIKALKKLGVEGKFHTISSGKSLLNFIEDFSGLKEAIVLTDFDRTGDRLAEFCSKHLKRLGVEPVAEIRGKLKSLVHKDVKDIEGLAKFLQNQRAGLKV
jgi:5S rRNA maturation endonuclease (ribonuclease M5)